MSTKHKSMAALTCPHCTAPLDPGLGSMTLCPFCSHTIVGVPSFPWDPGPPPDFPGRPEDAGKPRIALRGVRYVIDGRLGEGDTADVFAGHRDAALTERVVLKVLAVPEDEPILRREPAVLRRLADGAAPGASYFAPLCPQLVAHGTARIEGGLDDATRRYTVVTRWRSGFSCTLADAKRAFPRGLDPKAAVWMWKRLLELLGWVHQTGRVHGAVLPSHILLHPRDHGAALVGWSASVPDGEPVAAISVADEARYPTSLLAGEPAWPSDDIRMSASTFRSVLSNDLPGPIAALLDRVEARPGDDAWALKEQVGAAAKEAFGPPRYVPFEMPASFRRRGR
ncbi:MAG: hypothetical protein AB8I08_19395 [Sandaracinaceae bacterium]